MSELPILVEWGHVISKLLVGGLAGLALLGYRAWRNHRDLTPAREDAHRMGLSIDEPREGPIAVRGVYHAANDERWLDCSGERIVLGADLAIVRGSAATWKRGTRTYTLHEGDSVIAIGTMARRAGGDATDYRESAGGWQLTPSATESAIQLCVSKPVACPRPLWPIRGTLVLAIVGAGAYFGLGQLGKMLVAHREYPREAFLQDDEDQVSSFAAEVACALPRYREKALIRYEIDLGQQPQTEGTIEKRIAIARLRGCEGAVILLNDLNRFDEAIETAGDCDHPEYARGALEALGRYDEAAQLAVPDGPFADDQLPAMIMAGRWREAAAYVETRRHRDAEADRCLARYLRSLAGMVDASAAETPASTNKTCRAIQGDFDADDYDRAIMVVRWAAAPESSGISYGDTFARWLVPHVRSASPTFTVFALRAYRAIDLGRFDEAAAEIAKAIAARPTEDPQFATYTERNLTHLLALRTGKPIAAFEPDSAPYYSERDEAALIRSGADPRTLRIVGGIHERVASAIASAAAGDGLPLARVYETIDGDVPLDSDYLLAIAPTVTAHREELVRALRNRRSVGRSGPTEIVHELAIQRDIMRLLGDTTEAARLQAIIDRHAKALADPVRLKALLLTLVRDIKG